MISLLCAGAALAASAATPSIKVTHNQLYTINGMVLNARLLNPQDVSKLDKTSVQTIKRVCGVDSKNEIDLRATGTGQQATVTCADGTTLDPQTAAMVTMASDEQCELAWCP